MLLSEVIETLKQKGVSYRLLEKGEAPYEVIAASRKGVYSNRISFVMLKDKKGKRYGTLFLEGFQKFDISKATKVIGQKVTGPNIPVFSPILLPDLPFLVDRRVFERDKIFIINDRAGVEISPKDLKKIFKVKPADITRGSELMELLDKSRADYLLIKEKPPFIELGASIGLIVRPNHIAFNVLKDKNENRYAMLFLNEHRFELSKTNKAIGKKLSSVGESVSCPLLLKIPIFIDKRIFKAAVIYLNCDNYTVAIAPKDLKRVLDFKIADITEEPESLKLLEKKKIDYSLIMLGTGRCIPFEEVRVKENPNCLAIEFLKDRKGNCYTVFLRADQKFDISKAAKAIGQKVNPAGQEDIKKIVPSEMLFCPLLLKIPIFVDKKVFEGQEIYFASGNEYLIGISPKDLGKVIDFKTADIAETF